MPKGLSVKQIRRVVEIMREDVPAPVGSMLIGEYHLAASQHAFIDALARLADETGDRPTDKENS